MILLCFMKRTLTMDTSTWYPLLATLLCSSCLLFLNSKLATLRAMHRCNSIRTSWSLADATPSKAPFGFHPSPQVWVLVFTPTSYLCVVSVAKGTAGHAASRDHCAIYREGGSRSLFGTNPPSSLPIGTVLADTVMYSLICMQGWYEDNLLACTARSSKHPLLLYRFGTSPASAEHPEDGEL